MRAVARRLVEVGRERKRSRIIEHVLESLRWTARRPCASRNCGTVCLCAPCHARAALAQLDPGWRP